MKKKQCRKKTMLEICLKIEKNYERENFQLILLQIICFFSIYTSKMKFIQLYTLIQLRIFQKFFFFQNLFKVSFLITIQKKKLLKFLKVKQFWVLGGFNVGLEQHQWAIADGLGFIPKDDPETFHRNFDPLRRGWLPHFGTPRDII